MVFPDKYKILDQNVIRKDDYTIVPIRYEDRVDIMKWRNEQLYHLRQPVVLTQENQDHYFNTIVLDLFSEDKPSQLLFSLLHNENCIGYGGLVHINWIDKNAELSFIMNSSLEKNSFEKYWSIYLSLIEKVGFVYLGFNKLFTYAFDLRPHLYTVLEKSGYNKEAELTEHCCVNDEFKSVVIHSKLQGDIYLKEVSSSDVQLTYTWANNKDTRKYSFSQELIELNEHKEWFRNKLEDNNCLYYICNKGGVDIGSIRFDIDEVESIATVSYLISPNLYGNGYGKKILELGEEKVKLDKRVSKIVGYVLPQNIASCKIFTKVGYKLEEEGDRHMYIKKTK